MCWSRASDQAGIIAEVKENQSWFILYVFGVLYKSYSDDRSRG